jgi:sigma-E factor negative regulatory protein RseB
MRLTMRILRMAWVFPALSAALAGAAAADDASCSALEPPVRNLLQAMAKSAAQTSYRGVVTLQRGGDMQVMELSHRVQDGEEVEQLSRLNGHDARVGRAGHPVGCTHPGRLLAGADVDGLCELATYYRFRVVPGERVAGREALRLRAEPRDMYRFGHVFDIDRESALLLRAATLSTDRRVLEQYQFASISFNAADGDSEAPVHHRAEHPHPDEDVPAWSGRAWLATWVPGGFRPTDAAPAAGPRKTYTDGLASFSVFVEPLETALRPGEGIERQGSTVAYTRGLALQGQPVLVTVLGEIPTNTARMVADAVRLR